jgi:glucokinase
MRACVDIGGTKVAVSLSASSDATADRPPQRAHRQDRRQRRRGGADHADDRRGLRRAGRRPGHVDRVGVSSAGPFVLRDGMVELATPNICGGIAGPARGLPNDWMTATARGAAGQALRPRVRVENDAVAALEAERRWGALQGHGPLRLRHLEHRRRHGPVRRRPRAARQERQCRPCGPHASWRQRQRRAVRLRQRRRRRSAGRRQLDRAALRPAPRPICFTAARPASRKALEIVDALCRVMGRMLYNLIATLDLQRISLGGSVFWHHRDFLLPRLQAQIDGKLPPLTRGCAGAGGPRRQGRRLRGAGAARLSGPPPNRRIHDRVAPPPRLPICCWAWAASWARTVSTWAATWAARRNWLLLLFGVSGLGGRGAARFAARPAGLGCCSTSTGSTGAPPASAQATRVHRAPAPRPTTWPRSPRPTGCRRSSSPPPRRTTGPGPWPSASRSSPRAPRLQGAAPQPRDVAVHARPGLLPAQGLRQGQGRLEESLAIGRQIGMPAEDMDIARKALAHAGRHRRAPRARGAASDRSPPRC